MHGSISSRRALGATAGLDERGSLTTFRRPLHGLLLEGSALVRRLALPAHGPFALVRLRPIEPGDEPPSAATR